MATASGVLGPKQTKGYFVTVGVLPSTMQYNAFVASGAGGSYGVTSPVAQTTGSNNIPVGQFLKDMGKTVVSSHRTFRKVQLLVPFGPVIGATGGANGAPFYIELATGQTSVTNTAPVAYLPGLM